MFPSQYDGWPLESRKELNVTHPDMLRCDGCKIDYPAEDLIPGRGSKVYCRQCKGKQK